MKFGSQLRAALYGEWSEYYLDYDGLKKHLKRGEKKEGGYTDKDEAEFVERLDKELEKIHAFQNTKYEEIKGRVQHCENAVESISNVPSMNIPDKYAEVEREINDITEELNELARYARLNYTGIMKIIKKHDRRTRYNLRPMFSVRLNACPFYKETFEPIVVQLSKLYHIVHQGLGDQSIDVRPSTPNFSALTAASPSWKPSTSEERILCQTYKYWVHPDNLMEVKTSILRHLPVLVYPGTDSSITSIYFDNELFELYQDKVDRKPGDQIIRLRWYGNKMNNKDIFLERKIRKQGEDEIKDRFLIKEKHVDAFLKGEYSMDKAIKKMKENPSKTEDDIQQFQTLIKEIQDIIRENRLEPVLRTYYNRMAFQIPGDQHVRISLDTDFYMIREDNFENVHRRRDNEWRRSDIDENSFDKLPSSESVKFPFAVLEVKLKLDEGEQEPAWVKELVSSHLVEEAPQFSKYVHGVATLFTSHAPSLPYWLPNIDKDIIKPPSARQLQEEEEYPESSTSTAHAATRKRTISGKNIVNVEVVGGRRDRKNKGKAVDYNIEEVGGNENVSLLEEGREEEEEEEEDEQQKPIGLKTFRKMFQRKKRSAPEAVILPPNVSIPRKIITTVQVEPKVFLANERTFFSWMRFSVMLGTFSLALFNASGDDRVGYICGFMYAIISIIVLIYSLVKYNKRLTMINNRDPGPYDDVLAPPLVCIALFFAVGINFYLKYNPTMVEGNDDYNVINISTIYQKPAVFNIQNV
ncbi:VTC domain-containing protein [Glomus cerebriforme]|uniref:VTC domain-containing protein n=1 Tax=Glomus cerebriforme TaxID=658196 RepID=A0A397T9Z3_9GLOM|nr:VTC domain-containing protein [Glomus cerebriforme]